MKCHPRHKNLPLFIGHITCHITGVEARAVLLHPDQAAGRYIRSHEDVQRISIRNRLNDFMQTHGAELTAALAPELMGYNNQHPAVKHCVMQHSVDYLREALSVWLAAGEKINYSAQDNDILTTIGFRPDAASRDDNREKFTPAQNQNYVRKRAELAAL
ncbi:MAG: hypothetical protein LBE93_10870 [Enterobacter asburiae]|nr:hypothetical protein [Enterobacter asburiae]